jgi:hypothetical protein
MQARYAKARPGDWICPCSYLVFANRPLCPKCQKPRGPGSKVVTVQDIVRPGDWVCTACNDLNFASRHVCRLCGAPAPQKRLGPRPEVRVVIMKEGDWPCPACSYVNFASRSSCRECKRSKPPPPQEK